ncbi:MAG: SufD family Fe-S cluster assembly protein [Acholeplasmataceae bacterium]|nr:SufD family Fe-S cluster assembly protein [Acholeplasmataceae bacterium]
MRINKDEVLATDDEYLVISNGQVVEHSPHISDFNIDRDMKLKLFYNSDQDSEITLTLAPGINLHLTEFLEEVSDGVELRININLQKGARCEEVSLKINQESSKIRINTNIVLAEWAYIKLNELTMLAADAEMKCHFNMNEPNSKAEIKTVAINTAHAKQVYNIKILHNSSYSVSELSSFGIANHDSQIQINTDGIIQKGAAKVELHQKTKGLVLDSKSKISASPVLEINDYDCIANHGASIGAIDEDQLYYLMSRGITRSEAEKLIISGFINPFFASVGDEGLLKWLQSWLNFNI